jgi:hypothetical protein
MLYRMLLLRAKGGQQQRPQAQVNVKSTNKPTPQQEYTLPSRNTHNISKHLNSSAYTLIPNQVENRLLRLLSTCPGETGGSSCQCTQMNSIVLLHCLYIINAAQPGQCCRHAGTHIRPHCHPTRHQTDRDGSLHRAHKRGSEMEGPELDICRDSDLLLHH